MAQIFQNNAETTLALQYDGGSTLEVADSSEFPSLAGGGYFNITLVQEDVGGSEVAWEILKISYVSGNTFSVEARAQEGTTPRTWPVATRVSLRLTASAVQRHEDHVTLSGNPHGTTAAQVGADPVGTATTAVAAHVGQPDPHSQYTTQAEAESAATAAVAAHVGQPDPHSQYTTQAEAESAATAAVTAHVAQSDPHSQYTTASEASAAAPVQSVAGKTGAVVLVKADVGLSQVDNTADLSKPVSTLMQAALDAKRGNSDVIGVAQGGTGATDAAGARSALGLANHEKVEVDAGGNVGIGVTPSAWRPLYAKAIQVGDTGAALSAGTAALSADQYLHVCNNGYTDSDGAWVYARSKESARYEQFNGSHKWLTAASGTAGSAITWTQAMTLDAAGNLLVGVPSGSTRLRVVGANSGSVRTFDFSPAGGGSYCYSGLANAILVGGESGSNAAVYFQKDSVTGKSINVAGAVSAPGMDYSEYETAKAEFVGQIAKGAIVGFDANNMLTLNFNEAISFGVKSTNPSFVGGDTWGAEEALGMKRPEVTQFTAPEYTGSQKPADLSAQPAEPVPTLPPEPVKQEGETKAVFAGRVAWWKQACQDVEAQHRQAQADYADALAAWEDQADAHSAALAQFEADRAAHKAVVEATQAEFDTVTMPAYQKALAEFETALEAARQQVDRIAYSGKVPCNVYDAKPGDYIVAVRDIDGGIAGVAVAKPTFEQYQNTVGRVRRIEADGRANIAVMVH